MCSSSTPVCSVTKSCRASAASRGVVVLAVARDLGVAASVVAISLRGVVVGDIPGFPGPCTNSRLCCRRTDRNAAATSRQRPHRKLAACNRAARSGHMGSRTINLGRGSVRSRRARGARRRPSHRGGQEAGAALKQATFKATLSGSQVTTWEYHHIKDQNNPCDAGADGNGDQTIKFDVGAHVQGQRSPKPPKKNPDLFLTNGRPAVLTAPLYRQREGDRRPQRRGVRQRRRPSHSCPGDNGGADPGYTPKPPGLRRPPRHLPEQALLPRRQLRRREPLRAAPRVEARRTMLQPRGRPLPLGQRRRVEHGHRAAEHVRALPLPPDRLVPRRRRADLPQHGETVREAALQPEAQALVVSGDTSGSAAAPRRPARRSSPGTCT